MSFLNDAPFSESRRMQGAGGEGRVASLHLHPAISGDPLRSVEAVELIAEKGVQDDARFFGRKSRASGKPSRRQVSLIAREQIGEHAATLGLETIPPGAVRSNIETVGIDLISLMGSRVIIGAAILYFYEARTPCEKMDAICAGLRGLMENSRQGVMAEVLKSGSVRVGDVIRVASS